MNQKVNNHEKKMNNNEQGCGCQNKQEKQTENCQIDEGCGCH